MHRHWTQRVGALLFAIWFAVAGFEPVAAYTCPMHQMQAAMHMASHAGTSMDMGADHGSAPAPANSHSNRCTCPGCCSSVVLRARTPVRQYTPAAPGVEAPEARPTRAPATWTDFLLPFPTAPPSAHGPLA